MENRLFTRLYPLALGEFTRGLHALVFQLGKLRGLAITHLDRTHLLAVDIDWGLEVKNPASRFSSYGDRTNKLAYHGDFLFGSLRLETDANNGKN